MGNGQEVLKSIIEKPKRLSPEQEKAVVSAKKYLRIVAGAGTGKTETLTRRIAYLLLYKGEDPKLHCRLHFYRTSLAGHEEPHLRARETVER